jgi:hypothetical protein
MEPTFAPEVSAIALFVAKVNPNMVRALGGAHIFESALTEIGLLVDDDSSCLDNASHDGTLTCRERQHFNCADMVVGVPLIKKRRIFKREKKEDSTWWRKYLSQEKKLAMNVEPEGRVAKKFRRNFRIPYAMYQTKIWAMARERWWPGYHDGKMDAYGRLICDLELKLLGALFVLANGSTQFIVSEFTDISEEVHRQFFKKWLQHMASVKDEFIFFPRDDVGHNFVVDEYASIGFPGCIGSVDCVHIGWDKCPHQWTNLYKGKELHPSVSYQVVCTSRKFIQSVSPGHPGSRND